MSDVTQLSTHPHSCSIYRLVPDSCSFFPCVLLTDFRPQLFTIIFIRTHYDISPIEPPQCSPSTRLNRKSSHFGFLTGSVMLTAVVYFLGSVCYVIRCCVSVKVIPPPALVWRVFPWRLLRHVVGSEVNTTARVRVMTMCVNNNKLKVKVKMAVRHGSCVCVRDRIITTCQIFLQAFSRFIRFLKKGCACQCESVTVL